jgi:dihydrofolate synthase/folylpolyglutamate synthase
VVKAPLLSIITSVSEDHMEQLGSTVAEIAAEKAGIIKPDVPVICGAAGEAARVVANRAYEVGAPLVDATKFAKKAQRRARPVWDALREDAGAEGAPLDTVMQVVTADIDGVRYGDIELSMAGAHQLDNAVIAMAAIENLRRRDLIRAESDGVRAGFRRAHLPGRFEVFAVPQGAGKPPLPVVLDGALNASGAAALAAAVRSSLSGGSITAVVGILSDKDVYAILRQVYWFSDHIILTRPPNARAEEPPVLMERVLRISAEFSCGCGEPSCAICNEQAPLCSVCPEPNHALSDAISRASKQDRGAVVVCGSLYLVSAIRKELLRRV